MINKDRIIPIQRTDFLSLLATTLVATALMTTESYTKVGYAEAKDVEGNFVLADVEATSGTAVILNAPAKKIEAADMADECGFFFVPAYDFDGVYVDGVKAEADIEADGISVYEIKKSGTGVTITPVTPQL